MKDLRQSTESQESIVLEKCWVTLVIEVGMLRDRAGCWTLDLLIKKLKVKLLSCVQLFGTPWTITYQAPLRGILQARILEWVAISFSRGSSQPRDWTRVSHIAGRCFNLSATREAREYHYWTSIPRLTTSLWITSDNIFLCFFWKFSLQILFLY